MREILGQTKVKVEIGTPTVEAHAFFSERPAAWQLLRNAVNDTLQEIVAEGQSQKMQERAWDHWQESLRWSTAGDVLEDGGRETEVVE